MYHHKMNGYCFRNEARQFFFKNNNKPIQKSSYLSTSIEKDSQEISDNSRKQRKFLFFCSEVVCYIYTVKMSQRVWCCLFIIVFWMEKDFVITQSTKINGKTYLVPHYNLEGYEKFLLPKLEFKGTHHVYFNPDDINQVYKDLNLDPNNLQCNLKYDPSQDKNPITEVIQKTSQQEKLQKGQEKEQEKKEQVKVEVKGKPRPPLREKGYTHFIHIPLVDACKETFDNLITTMIDQNDRDALVPLNTLHVTLMVFRLRSEADLPKWQKILGSLKLKKVRITLRGVGIFPVKPNTNYTKVLYIKVDGLNDLIHDLVQRAISQNLVTESELSHISLDKKTDTYRAQQQHLTILKTKGKDIIDATFYLKNMAKLNIPKPAFKDIRLSMIGSFDGEGYYDEIVVPVEK